MSNKAFILSQSIHYRTLLGFKDSKVFWEKIINSFFYFPFLWSLVVREKEIDALLSGNYKETFSRKVLRNLFWFWPRLTMELPWVNGGPGKLQNPESFASISQDHCNALALLSDMLGNLDKPVLDLGCNMGRHLNHLRHYGHTSLYGVDIMKTAFSAFEEEFPETFSNCNLELDIFQRYLVKQPNCFFNAIYTFGATVEYNHPSFALVQEICRVTNDLVMFSISEHQGGYARFWTYQFNQNGFDLVFAIRPWRPLKKDQLADGSLLIYRRKFQESIKKTHNTGKSND